MKKLIVTLLILLSFGTFAENSKETEAFQLSLTPDIAIHDENTMIKGIALNIWGQNEQRALSLGFVNGSTGDSSGVSFAFLVNYAEDYTGAQIGSVNYASGNVKGVQLGFVNYAEKLEGVQLGYVNYTETMKKGLQVGLVNIIRSNDKWFEEFPSKVAPAMIFLNWSF